MSNTTIKWTPARRRWSVVLLLAGTAPVVRAQQPSDLSKLSLTRIFSSGEFRAQRPGETTWLDDSTYATLEPSGGLGGVDLVAYNAATGVRRVVVAASAFVPSGAAAPLDVEGYQWAADGSRLLIFTNSARVWRANTRGDFWVLDVAAKSLRKLGGTSAMPQTLQFAKFSPDGKRVAYVREHNLYVESLTDGAITTLTGDGSRTVINGTFDWVYEEELYLRDGFRWSPDGTSIAYWQLDASGVRDFLLINNTDSLYSFTTPVQYPKAGTTNSSARIGVVKVAGGATTWLAVPGDPRNNYLARMDWAANSTDVLVQQLDRRQQARTFWMGHAANGQVRSIFVERDSAWVDIYDDLVGYGQGPSVHWVGGNKEFLILAEIDGWRHVYAITRDGAKRLVTNGAYDVMQVVHIDDKRGWLYFHASPANATQQQLWRTRMDGSGKAERITPSAMGGVHEYSISPRGSFAMHDWSSFGTPASYDLVALPSHAVQRTMVTNAALKAKLSTIAQMPVEFMQIPIGDGVTVDAYVMKPSNFDATKKYPVLFTVYGEPAAQTVVDRFGGSTWMWHLMLTQEGYIVASIDQRGTPAPKGRDWRKVIRGQMGALRVKEQSAAARAIGRLAYVDSTRMGVWGWSGGGASTLLLMFRAPDVYRMGMSVAPVTDVHNYDTIYQERYVGLPTTDSLAYRDASAVNFVSGLKGDLLVVHGTGDDNVHFQSTEQLINALIKANKPFQMMAYPNRTHGIYEGAGTTRHLYELLTRYLHEHLQSGGVAR